jgi:hypothetical protein
VRRRQLPEFPNGGCGAMRDGPPHGRRGNGGPAHRGELTDRPEPSHHLVEQLLGGGILTEVDRLHTLLSSV